MLVLWCHTALFQDFYVISLSFNIDNLFLILAIGKGQFLEKKLTKKNKNPMS